MDEYTKGSRIGGRTLFFTASWCPPCQQVKRAVARQSSGAVAAKLLMVDVESPDGERLATKHRVRTIPTFVRPDGKRQVGALTLRELSEWIGAGED